MATPGFEAVGGQVQVPEQPGLGVTLDRHALEQLKAHEPEPLPSALLRIVREGGPTIYARPPLSGNPHLKPHLVPGAGDGYDLPIDQDCWYDDGSEQFADLWARTEDGLVVA